MNVWSLEKPYVMNNHGERYEPGDKEDQFITCALPWHPFAGSIYPKNFCLSFLSPFAFTSQKIQVIDKQALNSPDISIFSTRRDLWVLRMGG